MESCSRQELYKPLNIELFDPRDLVQSSRFLFQRLRFLFGIQSLSNMLGYVNGLLKFSGSFFYIVLGRKLGTYEER